MQFRWIHFGSRWSYLLLLIAFCGILFFYGLSCGDLYRTENLRAIIAAEFLRTGNWIVPMLYGEPLFTKPPGMYAAIALCSSPFGSVTDASARLPSALAATATVFLFYWYFSRQLGRKAGMIAALVLPISLFWLEKGTAAEIDMLQVFWTQAAILFFLRSMDGGVRFRSCPFGSGKIGVLPHIGSGKIGVLPHIGSGKIGVLPHIGSGKIGILPHMGWLLLAFVCVAGGLMTKWTTPAFFYVTIVSFLCLTGRLRVLFTWQHIAGIALVCVIFFSWAGAAIALSGWDIFTSTIQREALQRLHPGYTSEPYPWLESLLHPLKLLMVMLPFSPLAVFALRRRFFHLWDEKGKRLLIALHCWVWPNMLFWSLPTEHTPRHSAPLFPGIAGLVAMVLMMWMTGKLPWRLPRIRPGHILTGILLLWLGLKLGYVHGVMAQRTQNRQTRTKGELLAALIPIDKILYIFRLKDEGLMFYFGREALRLSSPSALPVTGEPFYCVLLPAELTVIQDSRQVEVIRRMTDAQGDPIVLVWVGRR